MHLPLTEMGEPSMKGRLSHLSQAVMYLSMRVPSWSGGDRVPGFFGFAKNGGICIERVWEGAREGVR